MIEEQEWVELRQARARQRPSRDEIADVISSGGMQEEKRAHGHSPEVERHDNQLSACGRSYQKVGPAAGLLAYRSQFR
jgi:hypothetical protein